MKAEFKYSLLSKLPLLISLMTSLAIISVNIFYPLYVKSKKSTTASKSNTVKYFYQKNDLYLWKLSLQVPRYVDSNKTEIDFTCSICAFPFQFDGKEFNQCTSYGFQSGGFWCSTKVDHTNRHLIGNWANCGDQTCQMSNTSTHWNTGTKFQIKLLNRLFDLFISSTKWYVDRYTDIQATIRSHWLWLLTMLKETRVSKPVRCGWLWLNFYCDDLGSCCWNPERWLMARLTSPECFRWYPSTSVGTFCYQRSCNKLAQIQSCAEKNEQ